VPLFAFFSILLDNLSWASDIANLELLFSRAAEYSEPPLREPLGADAPAERCLGPDYDALSLMAEPCPDG